MTVTSVVLLGKPRFQNHKQTVNKAAVQFLRFELKSNCWLYQEQRKSMCTRWVGKIYWGLF